MILPIVQYGDPVLREKCRPIQKVDKTFEKLATDMIETMNDAEGVGLAAPQIGQAVQMAVVDVSQDPECISYLRVDGKVAELADIMPLVFINPKLEFGEEKEPVTEGCLSIQKIQAKVIRPIDVKATLPQLDGSTLVVETDGLLARAIQHETDHLNGILFIDRLNSAAKLSVKTRIKRLAGRR